jgi:hypothetical protein
VYSLAFVGACASARVGTDKPIDASSGDDDDDASVRIDAPLPIDAPVMATLSETVNSTVVVGNSIACLDGTNQMADTNWYRVFQLSDFSITGPFHVESVTMAVQNSAGTPTLTFNIGTYAGAIDGSTIDMGMYTQLATANQQIPNSGNPTTAMVPLVATIPAGGKFVVQIVVPQQSGSNHYVFIGATTAGETHPGYWEASDSNCTNGAIKTTVGDTPGQIIINVNGTH